MFVKYSFRDDTFYFDPADIPSEHYVGYGRGTEMYDYLSTLIPLERIRSIPFLDTIGQDIEYIFRLSDQNIFEMPWPTPIDWEY